MAGYTLKAKTEGSMRLTYTGLRGELGHLKIEMRLRGEGVCECDGLILKAKRSMHVIIVGIHRCSLCCPTPDV
jgi:hypothetical protein